MNVPWCGADYYYSVCLALDLLSGPPLHGVWVTTTTVSTCLWISSVNLLWCVADCYYSVCLALDLLSEATLVWG